MLKWMFIKTNCIQVRILKIVDLHTLYEICMPTIAVYTHFIASLTLRNLKYETCYGILVR